MNYHIFFVRVKFPGYPFNMIFDNSLFIWCVRRYDERKKFQGKCAWTFEILWYVRWRLSSLGWTPCSASRLKRDLSSEFFHSFTFLGNRVTLCFSKLATLIQDDRSITKKTIYKNRINWYFPFKIFFFFLFRWVALSSVQLWILQMKVAIAHLLITPVR